MVRVLVRHIIKTRIALLLLSCLTCQCANAVDVIIYSHQGPETDRRGAYAELLLQKILQRTEKEYGPFKIEFAGLSMERDRKLLELKTGKLINVAAMPTSPQWEQMLIPVPIPIDMGMQSWRISLIDEKNGARLHAIRSLEELKQLKVGVGKNWVTYFQMQKEGFNVVAGSNYDGLFSMLMAGRFDYLPRALKDVFAEFDARTAANPSLGIEDSFVLFHPFPTLFFISPGEPRLAKRISAGMEAMLKDGSLQRTMLDFHADLIRRADLCSRHIFKIPNSESNPAMLKRKEIWFDPLDPKNGICPDSGSR